MSYALYHVIKSVQVIKCLCILIISIFIFSCAEGPEDQSINTNGVGLVVGKDNRQPFSNYEDYYPFKKIVALNGCTGSLVGVDLVLTAAHCIHPDVKKSNNGYVLDKDIYVTSHTGEKALVESFKVGSFNVNDIFFKDWALLKINKDFGNKYGYFKVLKNFKNKSEVTRGLILAGFSRDIPGLSFHYGCELKKRKLSSVYVHDCDQEKGASGAPILKCDSEVGCRVLGINIGSYPNLNINIALISSHFFNNIFDY